MFAIALGVAINAYAVAPIVLYSDPLRESPVRAVPDELMIIAGSGLSSTNAVVYLKIDNTTLPLVHPNSVPSSNTSITGVAAIVASNDAPQALTVRLPAVMLADTSYAFWVRASATSGAWSNGFKTNDARPMWISPEIAYRTAGVGTIGRQLKVVGRNLQPAPGSSTTVTLTGPTTYTLTADPAVPGTAIAHYVAKVTLPNPMLPGTYTVKVKRDALSQVQLVGQSLTVRADPATPTTFSVGSYLGYDGLNCAPNDGKDDTACVVAAIAAATPSGGRVSFAAGVWDLGIGTPANPPPDVAHGIVVPLGVSIVGAGQSLTTGRSGTAWRGAGGERPSVFTLQGRNLISDATFLDAETYNTTITWSAPYFALGKLPWLAGPSDPTLIDEVTFMRNTFARPYFAISDGGFPVRHLIVTGNVFGAYQCSLYPAGNQYLTNIKYRIDDSIIVGNTFKPGGYYDPAIYQGTIASQIGAAYRLDFSGNTADGFATDYLDDPAHPGWRAAFFWHMNNNHEYELVSQNTATCTGDKAGDGELIDYDQNGNRAALPAALHPSAVTSTTITLPGPLKVTSPIDFYAQHWIQIVDGTGVGQTRKIVSYTDPTQEDVTFTISPAWDVIPSVTIGSLGSRASVARQYWQVYTVDNTVDIRGCQKANPTKPASGLIALWGLMVDSTVDHNTQYESDGILFATSYSTDDPDNGLTSDVRSKFFVEVRANTVNGEYDFNNPCSWSGISLGYGTFESQPGIVEGYGINVVKNTVIHADGLRGGAITIVPGWFYPTDAMYRSTLIQRNTIQDLVQEVPPLKSPCEGNVDYLRMGIDLFAGSWKTVLFANTITNVTYPIVDGGTQTVQVP
jgi:hypothetical protein